MRMKFSLLAFILSLFSCEHPKTSDLDLVNRLSEQLKYAVRLSEPLRDSILTSPRTVENGKLKLVASRDWTSGFFPGNLWMIEELTGDTTWRSIATEFTLPLEKEQWNAGTHDMGFKMFCSFGKAYSITGNPGYKKVLIQSAYTLATRFNANVGCLRSWDHNADKWDFPVIIDNMMNLELLMWASKETGDGHLKDIAVSHARTTMKNHFRADNSSYHVIDYNPETGEIEHRQTHQGYSDESSWARGQAWGLYGYTMMYRETGLSEFLEQAEKIAAFILSQPGLEEGAIPVWDFNAPNIPNEPYDASAGAIITSALYELSQYSTHKEHYIRVAESMLSRLSSPEFLAPVGENMGFLLKHSTGHLPHNSEIDVPIVYADYYFLEAIIRKQHIENI
ncbi:glycoside hydrolase family 88 protein [Maribellus sp. CM-23]|uniref:glycoside hydrolase family 88 protein n=1 Tax=Maribellus sp. CM-23 TaxID=2781026 RepID=UPI001F40CAB8|nr:glycoside hydrolase family 88 protein [Maribellus sp. CM-23]MCE4564005.1 glycoside hydrolase family 88 protein [Maribellus sp. CM-23]